MMKKGLIFSSAIMLSLIFIASSCKEDEPAPMPTEGTLSMSIELFNGTTPMEWDETVSIAGINEYRMEFFKFYLSNLYAVSTSGEKTMLSEVLLADASVSDGMTFNFQLKNGSYDKLEIGVGLDSLLNASDPVQFSNEHPLSAAQAMYWSWAAKYRFTRIDGRGNENGSIGSNDDLLLAYHPGADEFYRTIELVNPFTISGDQTTTFSIKLDVAAFYNGPGGVINIPTEPQTHTEPSDYHIAVKFTDNFVAAFSPM
jgi:hypothetical protein